MERTFINQTNASNKFWTIKVDGCTQTVRYGKIGTKGRTSVNQLTTEDECRKESEALIASKLKKGYVELKEGEAIPKKQVKEPETDEELFWDAIAKSDKKKKSKWDEYDIDEHVECLTNHLSRYSKKKLIGFEKQLQLLLAELYTGAVADLYVILNNNFIEKNGKIYYDDSYISTDGFIYFRCWLLLKGKEFVDDLLASINTFVSGKYSFDLANTWAEGLLYVAEDAYSMKHDNKDESEISDAVATQYPDLAHYDALELEMKGKPTDGSKLHEKYPQLVEEMAGLLTQHKVEKF